MLRYLIEVLITSIIITIIIIVTWNETAYRDINFLKLNAPEFVETSGFTITSYDKFNGNYITGGSVTYEVRDKNDNLYLITVIEWHGLMQIDNIVNVNNNINI